MRAPIVSPLVFFVTLEAASIMMPPAVFAAPRMTKKNPAPECDQRGRVKAVRTAGEALSPEAVQLLAESLGDARPKVRKEAIKALSRLVDPASIDLIGRLATRGAKEHQRAGAVEVLGKIHSTSAVDPLKAALRDPNPYCRANALAAQYVWQHADAACPEYGEQLERLLRLYRDLPAGGIVWDEPLGQTGEWGRHSVPSFE
jgi:HEAT repeat protein